MALNIRPLKGFIAGFEPFLKTELAAAAAVNFV
jgi:hypothetical protein